MSLSELAVVRRSGLIESRHYGSLVVLDVHGGELLRRGDPDAEIFPRSSAKPAQASGFLHLGADLSRAEIAQSAGSHDGEDEHVRMVNQILSRSGLNAGDLGCPAEWPEDEATRNGIIKEGGGPDRMRMNCSGKHAAMLHTCVVNGWPIESYLDPEHPLQTELLLHVERLTRVPVKTVGVDGCGAPLFSTTLIGLARMAHELVLAADRDTLASGSRFSTSVADSYDALVANSMRENPLYVGGTRSPDTLWMSKAQGFLVKGGAEGVMVAAAPDGVSLAIKIVDGSLRAATLIAIDVFILLGYNLESLSSLTNVPVIGGESEVGQIEPGEALTSIIYP